MSMGSRRLSVTSRICNKSAISETRWSRKQLALNCDRGVHRQPPNENWVDAQHVDDQPRGDLAAVNEPRVPVLGDALVVVCRYQQ